MDTQVVVVELLRIGSFAADDLGKFLELPGISVAHLAEHKVVPSAHVWRFRLLEEKLHRDLLVDFLDLHSAFLARRVTHTAEVLDGLKLHYAVRTVDAQMPTSLRAL